MTNVTKKINGHEVKHINGMTQCRQCGKQIDSWEITGDLSVDGVISVCQPCKAERHDVELKQSEVRDFVLSGNVVFTITNTKTGNEFVYRVQKCETNYRVSLFQGGGEFDRIGDVTNGVFGYVRCWQLKWVPESSKSVKAASWFFKNIDNLGPVKVTYRKVR